MPDPPSTAAERRWTWPCPVCGCWQILADDQSCVMHCAKCNNLVSVQVESSCSIENLSNLPIDFLHDCLIAGPVFEDTPCSPDVECDDNSKEQTDEA